MTLHFPILSGISHASTGADISNLTSNNFPFLWSGFLSRKELICTSAVSLFLSLYDESMKPPLNCNESVMTGGRLTRDMRSFWSSSVTVSIGNQIVEGKKGTNEKKERVTRCARSRKIRNWREGGREGHSNFIKVGQPRNLHISTKRNMKRMM